MPNKTELLGPSLQLEHFAYYAQKIGNFMLKDKRLLPAIKSFDSIFGSSQYPTGVVAVLDPKRGPGISIIDTTPEGRDINSNYGRLWDKNADEFMLSAKVGQYDVRKGLTGWVYAAYIQQLGSAHSTETSHRTTVLSGEDILPDGKMYVGFMQDRAPQIAAVNIPDAAPGQNICYRPAITVYAKA